MQRVEPRGPSAGHIWYWSSQAQFGALCRPRNKVWAGLPRAAGPLVYMSSITALSWGDTGWQGKRAEHWMKQVAEATPRISLQVYKPQSYRK